MLTVAFALDRAESRYGAAVDYVELARLAVTTWRRAAPDARVVQVTSVPGVELRAVGDQRASLVDEVVRRPRGADFCEWLAEALQVFGRELGGRGPVLYLEADALLLREPEVRGALGGGVEVGWCRYPARTRPEPVPCGGVILAAYGLALARLYAAALRAYRAPGFAHRNGWSGIEEALDAAGTDLARRGEQLVRDLDHDTWCWTPERPGEDPPAGAVVAHFRGHRKAWMAEAARRWNLA